MIHPTWPPEQLGGISDRSTRADRAAILSPKPQIAYCRLRHHGGMRASNGIAVQQRCGSVSQGATMTKRCGLTLLANKGEFLPIGAIMLSNGEIRHVLGGMADVSSPCRSNRVPNSAARKAPVQLGRKTPVSLVAQRRKRVDSRSPPGGYVSRDKRG